MNIQLLRLSLADTASSTVFFLHLSRHSHFVLAGDIVVSFYPRDVVSAVYATATWLAGWVSVTRRYCIKTAKPILKLFRPSGIAPSF